MKAQIAEVIANAKENREKVRKESKSGELKRNPFVNLDEKGILNPDAIVKEWDLVQAKNLLCYIRNMIVSKEAQKLKPEDPATFCELLAFYEEI